MGGLALKTQVCDHKWVQRMENEGITNKKHKIVYLNSKAENRQRVVT